MLVALAVMYSAQQLLTPIFAPLSNDLNLTATQLGLVLTIASVAFTLASPLWGLALDAIGLRAVLIAGLVLCVAGLAGFAAAVTFGLDETLTPGLAFTFMLVFRSFLLSAGLAVLPVAALAVAGTVTVGEGERTRAVGLVGAAQGLSAVIGPPVGGALAVVSLMLPLYLAPVIALLLAVVVLLVFKPPVERPQQTVQTRPWELLPAFGVGFLMYLSFGLAQVVVALLVRERLEFTTSSFAVGGVLLVSALGLVMTQGVVVPLVKWPAARLMRTGAPIAMAGYAVLAVATSLWLAAVAFLVVAVGLGLAVSGFAAAASLGVGPKRQGLVAGLVNATYGLTFIIGPMLSTLLYDFEQVAPVIAAGVAAALACALSLVQLTPRVPQPVA
ncbi:MFS transporter [Lentzea sp. PSKA42]|uniref:MFS transporter n=1 Tax=Lentzea indica TaxID=2604800 RepID=A0ABX1FEE6_9PSEU|nr:MFS transporter [Lentzea indica]NKE57336.1 MFS transporter [Lentzea indica]